MRRLELLLIPICVLVTIGLAINSAKYDRAMAQGEFKRLTEASVRTIEDRMQTYLHSLSGAAAFLSSSANVTAVEFDNYVESLDIEEFLPGINGIGFIEPVARGTEEEFLSSMRAIGSPEFAIHPETDTPERFVISRISPLEPNRQALGLDITFEAGRRNAARTSRDNGTPQLTPRILLVQDATKEPGFLLLRPLYWEEATTPDDGKPASGFRGWVYAPFVGNNLLQNLTASDGRDFRFSVYDGRDPDPETMIYTSDKAATGPGKFNTAYAIEKYGRVWTVTYASTPAFEAAYGSLVPFAILLAGGVLTALLVFSIRNLVVRNEALSELAAMRRREISAREQENRSVVENDVTAVLILGSDRTVLFANQAAHTCFGYPANEMRGLKFSDLVTELDAPADDHNAVGVTKNGASLVLDLQCNSWLTSEGVMRMTAIVRDLTTLHRAQKEIEKTKTAYDLALRGAQIGVFDIDLTTGTSDVSDTWYDIMGVPRDGAIDTQSIFMQRVHPDDLPILKAADEACISGKKPRSTSEFRVRFPGDQWRWMRSDAVIVERDKAGNARRMIGTQTDVTDLRHARNALETSEKRFRQVLESAPIGMALMSERGDFTIVNDAFCTLVGRDEQSLINNGRMSQMMSEEEAKKMYRAVMAMVANDSSGVYTAEHPLFHSSGEERWGLFNVSWTYDKNLGCTMFIAQVNDITDKKKLEQVKNEFVSTVSHELRTPLTSIKGALGLISAADDNGLSPASKRLIEIARSNTDRLTDIVNDILDLEKIASGKVSFDFHTQDMRDLIAHAVKDITPFAVTHKNALVMDLPDTPIWVSADTGRTKQVLFNLISNACKYSTDNTPVTIKAEALGDVMIVYVQNIGPGVPESFRSRMFGAFSQADSSDTRARGGTGLGLNISKQIVNRHDGEIGFKSNPGGLTVFWFTYPRVAGNVEAPAATPLSPRAARTRKLRVLHVEDDVDFAEVVHSGLRHVADLHHVQTFAAARDAVQKDKFDVVMLDWCLPDGDARLLLDDIEKHQPGIRVLGLSADADIVVDDRIDANLVKSRTELDTIARHVCGDFAYAS